MAEFCRSGHIYLYRHVYFAALIMLLNYYGSQFLYMFSAAQVHMFSYQCSQFSTPETIIRLYDTAKRFQKEDTTTFASVVVLDEVGLAKNSPNFPLNVLHSLLEDGSLLGAVRCEEQEENDTGYIDDDEACTTRE